MQLNSKRHVFAPRKRKEERKILASLTFFFCPFSCFEDFHQVRIAGGLEPMLWHFTSYVFPADRITSFPNISTLSGFTVRTRFYEFTRYRRNYVASTICRENKTIYQNKAHKTFILMHEPDYFIIKFPTKTYRYNNEVHIIVNGRLNFKQKM